MVGGALKGEGFSGGNLADFARSRDTSKFLCSMWKTGTFIRVKMSFTF